MAILEKLRARLTGGPVPPRCPACTQDSRTLERVEPDRWLCVVCAKEFAATLEDDGSTWRYDLTARRYRPRR